ncbi:MepB family protein [Joostella sp.]|uniref:MepB family protein n=1 Tax=Joostella sp. TaxID=2231138 RepID=UPI003A8F861A
MNKSLETIKAEVYAPCNFKFSDFKPALESKEYSACTFKLNGLNIIYRDGKVTPKKAGQFVTFWKRIENKSIAPFHTIDEFDFFVVTVKSANEIGQFVFPKSVLIRKGIISTEHKEGKRAFRVYSPWDRPQNKQAQRSQQWQTDYFYPVNKDTNLSAVKELFKK